MRAGTELKRSSTVLADFYDYRYGYYKYDAYSKGMKMYRCKQEQTSQNTCLAVATEKAARMMRTSRLCG